MDGGCRGDAVEAENKGARAECVCMHVCKSKCVLGGGVFAGGRF